jgi:3alpha(or 20beta)-hydroxysteroid dehydrogenase
MGLLDGRVALVTGGAQGIGEACVRGFVAAGAKVAIGDINDETGEVLADELGGDATYVRLDVGEEADWEAARDAALAQWGSIDVLVNNAGVWMHAPLIEHTLDDYLRVVRVNQVGTFLGIRTVGAVMKDGGRGGSIINISSLAGLLGPSTLGSYAATKFAVRGMTHVAANELAAHDIRVNAILPMGIMTPGVTVPGFDLAAMVAKITPLGRAGTPEEVASLALFLASDMSSFCTGGDFLVDGGVYAAGGANNNVEEVVGSGAFDDGRG